MGCCCATATDHTPVQGEDEELLDEQALAAQKLKEEQDAKDKQEAFQKMMQQAFWAFAGYSPHKKSFLYISKKDLEKFLEITNIKTPVDEIFAAIDTEVVDNRVEMGEFVDYFTNPMVNPKCRELQKYMEEQENWKYLTKALELFDTIDMDKSQRLEYAEFACFGTLIGWDEVETERMWHVIDVNDDGQITIDELFKWFCDQLYRERESIAQHGRISVVEQGTEGVEVAGIPDQIEEEYEESEPMPMGGDTHANGKEIVDEPLDDVNPGATQAQPEEEQLELPKHQSHDTMVIHPTHTGDDSLHTDEDSDNDSPQPTALPSPPHPQTADEVQPSPEPEDLEHPGMADLDEEEEEDAQETTGLMRTDTKGVGSKAVVTQDEEDDDDESGGGATSRAQRHKSGHVQVPDEEEEEDTTSAAAAVVDKDKDEEMVAVAGGDMYFNY